MDKEVRWPVARLIAITPGSCSNSFRIVFGARFQRAAISWTV
jgi:hypothetical protein